MIFRQLFDSESSTYTYLLADSSTREAILIDPVLEKVDRDLKVLHELGLKLSWILETHVHADHVTGAAKIRDVTGARIGLCGKSGATGMDRKLSDGDVVKAGEVELRVLETPGHTNGCLSYYGMGRVFTGDALFIRSNGRTDFQEGSAVTLYHSITEKLYHLPDETLVYPAHDYQGMTCSSILEEKLSNKRIPAGQSLEKFVQIMNGLNLPEPK